MEPSSCNDSRNEELTPHEFVNRAFQSYPLGRSLAKSMSRTVLAIDFAR